MKWAGEGRPVTRWTDPRPTAMCANVSPRVSLETSTLALGSMAKVFLKFSNGDAGPSRGLVHIKIIPTQRVSAANGDPSCADTYR